MLTPDGKIARICGRADGVHPNHAGYLVRVKMLLPVLGPPDKTAP